MTGRVGLPDVQRDEGGNPPYSRKHCHICKRPLDVAGVEDSRDCGGDCFKCVREIEEQSGYTGYVEEIGDDEYLVMEPTVGAQNFLVQAEAAQRIMEEVIEEHFTMQAAACTTQPDCTCGREHAPRDLNADLIGLSIPSVGIVTGTPAWSDGMYVAVECADGSRTCRLAAHARRLRDNTTSPTLSGERGGTE